MSTFDRVRRWLVRQFGVDPQEVTPDATIADLISGRATPPAAAHDSTFVDALSADSLDQVELVMALEEEFGLELAEHEVAAFSPWTMTVQELVDVIDRRSR